MLTKKLQTRKSGINLYKEIYIDCEQLIDHSLSAVGNTEKQLILLAVQLCDWLLLKDIIADFDDQTHLHF